VNAIALCATLSIWACSRTALDDDTYPLDANTDTSVSADASTDSTSTDGAGNDVIGDGGPDVKPDVVLTCAASCAHCCSAKGDCMPETNHTCGVGGEACRDCGDADAGWLCKTVCVQTGQPPCNTSNCGNGCCYGSYCSTGNENEACGSGGQPCDKCDTSKSEHCAELDAGGGVCTGAPACGPSTCLGCCYGEVCSVGTQDFACGTSGVACSDCLFMNGGYCDAGACASSK
jgi:hypothetical protein